MILPDTEIRHLCEEYNMVVGWDADLLNPASLDVRLGPDLLIEAHDTPEMRPHSIRKTTAEYPYLLGPGEFVLAHTVEVFNIPSDVCARFMLKSSRAREGLEHLLAGFADPGFHSSSMTLELTNARRLHPVPLWNGMRVGQMVFELMAAPPSRTYATSGRYNGCSTVTASLG
jgi:dCTP deaminase